MTSGRIISVEFAANASSSRPIFWRLKPATSKYRVSHISSIPVTYWRRQKYGFPQGSLLFSPPAAGSNGIFRIVYVRKVDKLDIRRATILAVTLNSTTSQITAMQFDPNGSPPIDSTELANHQYFCVVDKFGVIKMRNIPFAIDGSASIDSSGNVTIDSAFTYQSTVLTAGVQTALPSGAYNPVESAAVGDYIVAGKDTTTHSQLSEDVERYLIQFAAYKIFKHDSSLDIEPQLRELTTIETDIMQSYQEIDEDGNEVVITEEWDI